MILRNILKVSLLTLALLPAHVALAEDPLLSKFVGTWTGEGKVRLTEGGDQERIRCRLTNTLSSDGKTLNQTGRCGVANNTGSVNGTIRAIGDGRYGGSWNSLASTGPASLTGRERGGKLVMTVSFTDSQTGDLAVSTTTLSPGPNGYRMSSTRNASGGGSYGESDITFTAR